MYHASGHDGSDVIFESIDLDSLLITPIDISGSLLEDEEAQALTWWVEEGVFLWKQDHGTGPLYTVTTDGVATLVGPMDHQSKGLAIVGQSPCGDAPCPWDLDGGGSVGPRDLAQLLGNWGPNPGHPADFDGDDVVGPADLAQLLGNWGPCPK